MILIIDNYDSFVYNLYQMTGEINPDVKVIRNDECTIEEIEKLNPEKIIISPGPKRPIDAGISIDVVKHFASKVPILGVCLGHQAITEAFGGNVVYAKKLMHGKSSEIKIYNECKLFKGMPSIIEVARYHSLASESKTLPKCLTVIGWTFDDEIMAIKHRNYETYGVQFHPESILTPLGRRILENFLCIK